MSISPRVKSTCHGLFAAAMVWLAGAAAPLHAFEYAQTPLFLGTGAKPNFILAIDDSRSMLEQRVFPGLNLPTLAWNAQNDSFFVTGQPESLYYVVPSALPNPAPQWNEYAGLFGDREDGSIGQSPSIPPFDEFGFARSPDFNKMYFNPSVKYEPWMRHDGTRWPDANAVASHADPRAGAVYQQGYETIVDFKAAAGRQQADESFILLPGMTIPAGTVYRTDETLINDCGEWGYLPKTNGAWQKIAGDFKIVEKCRVGLGLFPATFFLRDPATLSSGFGYAAEPLFVADALGPGGVGLYRYQIRPENFVTLAAYEDAIGNFANWFQYHNNKILALVASTTEAFADIRDVRVGQFNINHRDDVTMYDLSVPLSRAQFYDRITGLQTSQIVYGGPANTPNREGVDHIGKQFRRTDPAAPITAACQANVGMLFTDGYTSKGTGPSGFGNADGSLGAPFADTFHNTMADIVTSYYEGENTPLRSNFPTGEVAVPASCATDPKPWVDCRTDLHMRFHAVAFGPRGAIYGVDPAATANPHAALPDWNAAGAPNGVDGPVVIDELWHATINGRGTFVNANSTAEVTGALQSALQTSEGSASVTNSIGANGTRRDEGFLGYVPHYSAADWSGDLTAHAVTDESGYANPVWSAAKNLAAMSPADRKIYVSDATQGLLPFNVSALGGESATAARLGLNYPVAFGRTVTEVVDYLRGDHAFEQKHAGGTLRDRTARLGDIVGSQPQILTRAGYGYSSLPKALGGGQSGSGSYGEFLVGTKATRKPVVFVGANDGMLHAFDASSGAGGGNELFAVIPRSVAGNVGKLADPAYKHRYFVNGSPVQGDAWDGSWKTVLLAPMGVGGNSIMALDATNPADSFGPQNFLWEFTDPDLHATLSPPSIVMLEGGTWAAIFGGGVDPVEKNGGKATFFIVDLFSGELLQKIVLPPPVGLNHQEQNGAIAYVAVDRDYNLMADAIYVTDYDAQLWRLDVDPQGVVSVGNGGQRIFRALDRNGRPLVVTGGMDSFPHHVRGHMVYFGTGRYLFKNQDETPNPGSTDAFFAIWDDPEHPSTFERASLQAQEIVEEGFSDGLATRRLTNHAVDWSTQRGWVIDLAVKNVPNQVAELMIGNPVIALGQVTFTTFAPSAGSGCAGGGVNRLYSVSATSGVGEIPIPGAMMPMGSLQLPESSGAAPLLNPNIVTSPPKPACVPGSEECPIDPGLPEGDALVAPSAGCKTALGVLLSDGLLDFGSLTCGRQSWQQLR